MADGSTDSGDATHSPDGPGGPGGTPPPRTASAPPRIDAKHLTTLLLLAIVVFGGLLRVAAVDLFYGSEEIRPGDVKKYYVGTAESYLEGSGWRPKIAYNFIPPPLQSVFIAAFWSTAPQASFGSMRKLQAILSIATILLAYLIGKSLGGTWAGVIAAFLIATDTFLVRFVGILLTENNYFFLLFAFLATLLIALERKSTPLVALSGALLGLTSLMKSFPMLLCFVVPAALFLQRRTRTAAIQGGVFFLAFAAVVAPWLIRNALQYGHFYAISTNSGTLLAQSNFIALDPSDPKMRYWEQIHKKDVWTDPEIEAQFESVVDHEGKREWNQRDRAYMRHFLSYVAQHPSHFLRNYFVKLYNAFIYPWHARRSFEYQCKAFVMILGLAGLVHFAIHERRRPRWILVPIFAYYLAFTALFHITRWGRINFPMKLLLSFFAAYFVALIGTRFVLRRGDPTEG